MNGKVIMCVIDCRLGIMLAFFLQYNSWGRQEPHLITQTSQASRHLWSRDITTPHINLWDELNDHIGYIQYNRSE